MNKLNSSHEGDGKKFGINNAIMMAENQLLKVLDFYEEESIGNGSFINILERVKLNSGDNPQKQAMLFTLIGHIYDEEYVPASIVSLAAKSVFGDKIFDLIHIFILYRLGEIEKARKKLEDIR